VLTIHGIAFNNRVLVQSTCLLDGHGHNTGATYWQGVGLQSEALNKPWQPNAKHSCVDDGNGGLKLNGERQVERQAILHQSKTRLESSRDSEASGRFQDDQAWSKWCVRDLVVLRQLEPKSRPGSDNISYRGVLPLIGEKR